jgi:chemotaxis protein methyltransferase CheR
VTLDPEAFERIRKLVYHRTAIVIDDGKEYLVESRLAPIARAHDCEDVSALCRLLDRRHEQLVCEVVEAMTTNETSFFRDHHPFEALKRTVLPDLMAKRAVTRSIRIWCAACSTGQEPYSLAMLIDEHFPELHTWRVSIIGTDISKAVLARARAGRYRQIEVNRGLGAGTLVRYFVQDGLEWEIGPHIKRLVRFEEHNLITPWPRKEKFDLVFLRNVLIYFDQPTKLSILNKMRAQVADDGFLVLGGSETPPNEITSFERVPIARAGIYRATGRRPSGGSHAR